MPRRRRPDLKKLLFVLPNLFTVSSIFCGFYAITLCAGEADGDTLYRAALLIFFATFFDAFDGRVARMTRTQSDFGMQLDSLADVISFGVAPGLLAYRWGLAPLGLAGVLAAFVFPLGGALRLARFNVIALREKEEGAEVSKFFVGLPIPLAAGMLVSLVIAHHKAIGSAVVHHGWVAVLVVVLGLLMVSNVRYRTFKDVGFSRKSALVFLFIVAVGVVVTLRFRASFALVGYFAAYIAFGLLEEIVFFRRRRREESLSDALEEAEYDETDEDELVPAEEDEEVWS
ncbi:MAG: CDP-diacylglycerol--serine O-phosphatidyltransferase [Deltaproteobacteria bacterium]|nr:MAG: CDP-diacylglycerol--serine O-phosphatidyltransferase [Deltaproteobacteria bacterium]